MTTPAHISERTDYTLGELMVASAAREIRDNEIVFVGMRLPLIAFVVAKRTHAPNAVGLFENGVIRSTPAPELIYTMADPPNILGATQCLDMLSVMSLLQSGRVDLGFLGAAEVDRFGNLNSTMVGDLKSTHASGATVEAHGFSRAESRPQQAGALAPAAIDRRPSTIDAFTRLPGSGGACDIASLAKRFVVLLEHSKRRLPERVSYITSPGHGDGAGWRQRVGLPRGGPSAAITTKAVLRFGEDGKAYLASVHPGVSVDHVLANTGWKLRVADSVVETPHPSAAELQAIREYDKEGFWTK
jgi:glutaconate CoA-transferase, subunit B